MREIPIFPLDLVLFPFSRIQLHIFEDRYRLMTQRCLARGDGFAINLSRVDSEEPYLVGTYAVIVDSYEYPDGRYDLTLEGRGRIRIRVLDETLPYLRAEVEDVLDDEPEDPAEVQLLAAQVRELCEARIRNSAEHPDFEIRVIFPENPEELSFAIANLMPLSKLQRQSLLETVNVTERLQVLIEELVRSSPGARSPIRKLSAFDLREWNHPN